MSNPEVLEKNPTNMSTVKDELDKIEKRDEELSFRGNRTMDYLNEFVSLDKKEADKLADELRDLDIARLKEEFIHKIVDGLPKNMEQLKVLLQGYTLSVDGDDMQKIMKVVKEYVEE